MSEAPLVVVRDVVRSYAALRPLRVQSLALARNQIVSVTGLDAAAAEVFVGLLTGALLPDTGEIELFGHSTRDVTDSDAWLKMLDGVGILTDRAVLIAQFTVKQNVALPFTLEIDPVAPDLAARVAALAREVGLSETDLTARVGTAPAKVVARVRLARALALDPSLLVAEHPSATLAREDVKAFAHDLAQVTRARGVAVLAMTADPLFAGVLGGEQLTLDPATGALRPQRTWTSLFRR
jgi:ABC-type transporter Mla maintaining outer membrane lipid asymmetry ATPase subunit MlaF